MSVRYHISLFFILATQFNMIAQKDTSFQTIRQEIGDYQAPVIETPSDRLFYTKVPSRFMGKWNMSDVIAYIANKIQPTSVLNQLPLDDVGIEYKCSPSFSLGGYVHDATRTKRWNQFIRAGWVVSAQARWYHDMKKRINSGRSANNFGGRYLALNSSFWDNSSSASFLDNRVITLRYGLQQRVLSRGYFDVSIGAGISNYYSGSTKSTVFSIDQSVSLGIGNFLSGRFRSANKPSNKDGGICEILHCQDEQSKMIKFSLLDLVEFQANGDIYNLQLRPNIAFEQKIGQSPFSIELALDGEYSVDQNQSFSVFDQKNYTNRIASANWNITGEAKWYYSMRKRILSGRSGNNLSGAFIGLQLNRRNFIEDAFNFQTEGPGSLDDDLVSGDYWSTNLVWGIQQRVLERGFIQFIIGAGSTFGGNDYQYEGPDRQLTKVDRQNELNLVADLKVGFAF